MKRIHELIAVVLLLAGLGGILLAFYFLYAERFIEGGIAGFLGFMLLRTGLFVLRLLVARRSLSDAHQRILDHLGEKGGGKSRLRR